MNRVKISSAKLLQKKLWFKNYWEILASFWFEEVHELLEIMGRCEAKCSCWKSRILHQLVLSFVEPVKQRCYAQVSECQQQCLLYCVTTKRPCFKRVLTSTSVPWTKEAAMLKSNPHKHCFQHLSKKCIVLANTKWAQMSLIHCTPVKLQAFYHPNWRIFQTSIFSDTEDTEDV